jgi:hypothetical protein
MDIEKDEIEGIVVKLGERIRGGFDDVGGYVQRYEFLLQGPAGQLVVVDDKDFRKKFKWHTYYGSKLNTIYEAKQLKKNSFYCRYLTNIS